MKILIQNDGRHAHYYIRLGLARAFEACGHQAFIWDIDQIPAVEIFDNFEPDIFIGQSYNITPTIANLIRERPHLKVELKASDWGPLSDKVKDEFPITYVTQKEKDILLKLHEDTNQPTYMHIHYHPDYIRETHGGWIDSGIPVYSQLSAADTFEFTNGQKRPELECDVCFIGGYWPYKANVLDRWLVEFCNKTKLRVKIFGNSPWPVHQYCGYIPPNLTKDAISSAKICVNLHEPHSQKYGFDIVERPFKLLANKALVVSDYVEGLAKLIPNGILYAKTPEEFATLIENNVAKPYVNINKAVNGHNEVMSKHTYFHRIIEIFNRVGYETEAHKIIQLLSRR